MVSAHQSRQRRCGQINRFAALASAAAAVVGSLVIDQCALAAVSTYTPQSTTTDVWSAGTNWDVAPASGATTELKYIGAIATVQPNSLLNTNTDDISGLFQLNILDFNGTGPATGTGLITIANSNGSTGLDFISNGATTPVVNLNALVGAAGFAYNVSAPVTLGANTLFQGAGTASFNFIGGINGSGFTLTKAGTSALNLGGTITLGSFSGGTNAAVGTVKALAGSSVTIGSAGVGTVVIGASSGSGTTAASETLDLSAASSVTMNVASITLGNFGGAGTASGTLNLPASSSITSAGTIVIGTSGAGFNNVNSNITTLAGSGTTTLRTAGLTVGGNKSRGGFSLGAGDTLDLAGVAGARAALVVGNTNGGGGSGSWSGNLDASNGIFTGSLSSLLIAGRSVTSSTATETGLMTLSSNAANHLDISGSSSATSGVVTIGTAFGGTTTGSANGTLTIGNLDATSKITSTSNNTAILLGMNSTTSGSSVPSGIGILNFNGGSLSIVTTGSAIAGGSGNSTVNFNGGTLIAGANSNAWITGLTNAVVADNGGKFNVSTFAVTSNQVFTHGGVSSTDGGLTLSGTTGVLTLGGASTFNGNTTINGGTLNLLGSLTSSITVNAGGGIGSYNTSSAAGSATGYLNFSAGTSSLVVNPNGSQFLTLAGAVTAASGASVVVTPTITTPTVGTPVEVLWAKGGINGTVGAPGSGANFVPNVRGMISIQNDSNGGQDLMLTASQTQANLIWTGNTANPTFWDTQVTQNWFNTGTSNVDQFYANDNVTFDDTASTFNVAIQGTSVVPSSVTFNNSTAHTYTLSGGAIADNGSGTTLTMNGSGTVIITNNNTYAGGTTINTGGTIQLGDGTVTTGTLGSGAITDNGALVVNYGGSGAVVLANTISGTGGVTKIGSAILSLTGSSNYSGTTSVTSGTLRLDGTGSLNGSGTIMDNSTILATGTNILGGNLNGAGNVTTSGTAVLKLAGSNTAFTGITTIPAGTTLQIGNGGTTGTLPGGTLSVAGTLAFNRSDTYTLPAALNVGTQLGINATVCQVGGSSSNVVLTGSNTFTNLNVGFNAASGTLTVPTGASLTVGNNGTGTINVGVSPNATGGVHAFGILDVSAASSFTANVGTFAVGTTGNQSVTSFGDLKLGAINNITAVNSFIIGDGAGAQNGNAGTVGSGNISIANTSNGGVTNIHTPAFTVGGSKASAIFTLGTGAAFNLSGVATGARSAMSVGYILTGGGTGTYNDTADFSAGTVNLQLSGLNVGVNADNAVGPAAVVASMHIGSAATNHIDISGPATGPVGNTGVVNIGTAQANVSTGVQTGVLTIDNLDSTSSIVATDNGVAINVGGAIPVAGGFTSGTLNLNGGTLKITTTGTAIGSDTNPVPIFSLPTSGTATVNFNGITLVAGASSTTWIQNLIQKDFSSGAILQAGGLAVDTNGFNITIPQQFNSGGSDGGITKKGAGVLTLSGANSSYSGPTNVANGTLLIPTGISTASGSTFNVGATVSGATPILAGTGTINGPAFVLGTGTNMSAGQISPGMTGATLGTLSFNNGVTFNSGADADFRLAVPSGSTTSTAGFSSLINVTNGALTMPTGTANSGTGSIIVNLTDDANAAGQGSIGSGTYELFSFGSLTNPFDPSEFTIGSTPLASGSTYTFSEVGGNQIDLTISAVAGPQNLVWSGGTPAWDIATTANWNNNTATFNQNDNVTFDDTNTGSLTVTINAIVTPGSITVNSSKAYIFNGTGGINGSTGLTESGGGSLTIQTVNTFTGATNVSGGGTTLNLASTGTLGTSSLTVGTGSIVNIAGGLTGTPAVTVNGTLSFGANAMDGSNGTAGALLIRNLGALNVTGTMNISAVALANHASRSLVTATSLTNIGKIDLSDNDMIIHNASMGSVAMAGSIANQIGSGYNAGRWNAATGIVSSTAASDSTHLTAIGYMPGGSSFDGISTISTDMLIKYTYYGDANLDGVVNSADYTRIDAGYLANATGWSNGDFNYDGIVNGSDYTLIDNAFNTQGASLSAVIASPTAQVAGTASAVPEPASLGLIGLSLLGLLGRKRRK